MEDESRNGIRPIKMTLHTESNEDRIEAVVDPAPMLIVADGCSVREDPSTGRSMTGQGGQAAEQAVKEALTYLENELPKRKTLEEVLLCLKKMYEAIGGSLQNENLVGATTLLVALLWKSSDETRFWCYAYEGDGFINLLSPSRKIDGIVPPDELLERKLLSPQKVDETASVSQQGCRVTPAVGCRLYEQGDLVYVASDGIIPLYSWMLGTHHMTLAKFILSHCEKQDDLQATLSQCPKYSDDATMGIIWTDERDERNDH